VDGRIRKKRFDFSCIKLSIGYYDHHTANEYIVLEEVKKSIKIGRDKCDSHKLKKESQWTEHLKYKEGRPLKTDKHLIFSKSYSLERFIQL